ncbi:RagB/SusD family nutrient uptake outer membrane protein [Sphingobacterium yanglingense]|uniref:SusD-like starch-binding protein associating with outer membrane n=1 Tax=Sphingobacterium yanglingense TaxID=1437280 RepID=A0A4R6WC35_9SPHI|nr:RagB/SusD family nutrient uptake outer membrane protein [Sphingobacterium yanglingense]TDQ75379.1 SusD-like starch-binding protein associating with outer membrane [Sphingobacterium yanglingense]
MRNICVILCLGILLGTLSCEKFLEEKSDKSLVTPSSIEDLQALLDDAVTMNTSTPGFMESMADDIFLTPSTLASIASGYSLIYSYNPEYYSYGNDWSKSYQVVYNANLCLERLEDIGRSMVNKSSWDNVRGTALFFRSYYYLLLAWQHAKVYDESTAGHDLGVVLRTGSDFNVKSVRSSVRETYEQIIGDLKDASLCLPDHPQHVMRPSKAAVYGLLARTYLSMSIPDSALKYVDRALAIKNKLMDYNVDSDINGSIGNTVPFKKFNKEIVFYTEMFAGFGLHRPARAKIDTLLYASYDDNDLRKAGFFRANSGYHQFKGSYAADANIFFSGIAVDELYLIRAECNARLGNVERAMSDLNSLLKSRWNNKVNYVHLQVTTAQVALELILRERRKELLMRGLRWIDIKRLNKEGAGISPTRIVDGKIFQLEPNDKFYALPLPDDIIRITGIEQN